jgi:recombination protein RecT
MGQLPQKKPTTIQGMLTAYKDQITAALPRHMSADRMARITLTSLRTTPKLLEADPVSLFGAVIQSAQLGLEPGITAHLIPFWNSKTKRLEVLFIPDYRGLISLVRRSGEIGQFSAHAVRFGDKFDYQYGTDEYLHHIPADDNIGSEITHFYALGKAKDGSWSQFIVMSKSAVDEIRARSKTSDNGPWVTDYEQMGCKTVARRLCKYLPTSIETQKAVQADELADAGVTQNNAAIITGEFEPITNDDEPQQLPAMDDEAFNKHLGSWTNAINNGKKSASDIIKMVGSKYTLTPDQKNLIMNIRKGDNNAAA